MTGCEIRVNQSGSIAYRKDENKAVFVIRSDRQIQCLCEQIAHQTASRVRGESDGLISPIGLDCLTVLIHPWIYRWTSESDCAMPSGRRCDAQEELAEGITGKSFT